MKVKLVYGPPCGGKTTYVEQNAAITDAIWDGDKIVRAVTTKKDHSSEILPVQKTVMFLRQKMVESLDYHGEVETLWFCCRYPNDRVNEILDGHDIEEIPIVPAEEECYERLEQDDARPDKDAWRDIIRQWYEEHGDEFKESSEEKAASKTGNGGTHSMLKFWNWRRQTVTNLDGGQKEERVLELNGAIAEESWWDDDVTPAQFREELNDGGGDIIVWINSPGGDCFAASQIYNMLREYAGRVTVKIDSLAASAASVVAMAGDEILISPTGMLMIHNPSTMAWGDHTDMQKAIDILDSVKESIINAYMIKTGLSHAKLSALMDDETWMDAKQAIKLGFCDGMLARKGEETKEPEEGEPDEEEEEKEPHMFAAAAYVRTVTNKLQRLAEPVEAPETENKEPEEHTFSVEDAQRRLALMKLNF